jgi:hypothetical protein
MALLALAAGCGGQAVTVEAYSHGGGGGGGGSSQECFSYGGNVDHGVYYPTVSPDNPWQPGQSGYVIATQPVDVVDITGHSLPNTPNAQVTIGWDAQFSSPLWFRASNAAVPANADSYKSLHNTIPLPTPIPDVGGVIVKVEAPLTEYVCFPAGSVEQWRQTL